LEKIFENFKQNELSYFDMNLETWRQLWRVIEISDIILLIVDIRYTALHFSPTFYNYCTSTLKKDVILVLNKIDLVELELVIAWKNYFKRKFPKLHILLFSSAKQIKYKQKRSKVSKKSAQYYDEIEEDQVIKKILAANIYTAQAHRQLYECVKNIVKDQVDLSAWSKFTENLLKQSTSMSLDNEINQTVKGFNELELNNDDTQVMEDLYTSKAERKRFENGFVTIGCCGNILTA
jgi:ribosome biogenesis GTPase A